MTGYADPETLVAQWLHNTLDVKAWCDPKPPPNGWDTAAWVWVQRGLGFGQAPLSMDFVLLDCDSYAARADHARALGQQVWAAMTLQLPKTTFSNGVFVSACTTVSAPSWAPDPKYRRAAAYQVTLHGFI